MLKTKKQANRILAVRIVHETDCNPDTSWLGEYSNSPSCEYSIDREERGDCGTREMRYFNPSFNHVDITGHPQDGLSPDEVKKYTEQDYRRMENYNAQQWQFIGIRAEAEIGLPQNGGGFLLQTISSGGLWGVEDEFTGNQPYHEEIAKEELSALRDSLKQLGFSTRAISKAFREVETV